MFNDDWTKEGEPSKFEQIIEILKEIREKSDDNGDEYKDYDICVTGHSLGGALSQLLSYALAGSDLAKDLPKPITTVTFASPQCGDRNWVKAYQDLEKNDAVRHIRVSNSGDWVCVNPAIPLMGYSQTGVNVHLFNRDPADVGYRNQRSAFSAIQLSNPATMHGLDTYFERLTGFEENLPLVDMKIEEYYRQHAGDYSA